jgi:hypothetical protein
MRGTCVDDGFSVTHDGFSFPNWGQSLDPAGNVTIQTLVKLFGHSAICRPGPTVACTPTPRALHIQREWNAALIGGRCEGMATLSERMFMSPTQVHEFDSSANVAADLARDNIGLESEITYWWTTQFTDDVVQAAYKSRQQSLDYLVEELTEGLHSSAGYTLGMYDKGMGHSVTPFAVAKIENGWSISVYDNNYPGVTNNVIVATDDGTWSYHPQSLSNGQIQPASISTAKWSGKSGTLELTPMSARSGPFTCSSCDDQANTDGGEEDIVVTLVPASTNAEIFVELLDTDGDVIASSAPRSTDKEPADNIRIDRSKDGGMPARTQIVIPHTVKDFDIRIVASALTVEPPSLLLAVSYPGLASMQIEGFLASVYSSPHHTSQFEPSVVSVRQTSMSITPHVDVTASVATTAHILDAPIKASQTLTIQDGQDDTVLRIANAEQKQIFINSFPMTALTTTTPVRRVVLRDVANTYNSVEIPIQEIALPEVSIATSTPNSAATTTTTSVAQGTEPMEGRSDFNIENTLRPPLTQTTTTSVPSTSRPPASEIVYERGVINLLHQFSSSPRLLHVDSNSHAWVHQGNSRFLTQISSSGTTVIHGVNGIPIAMTEDGSGDYWVALHSPSQLLRISKGGMSYFSHPDLVGVSSIEVHPANGMVHLLGTQPTGAYVATYSRNFGFAFQPLTNISRPELLTSGPGTSLWFTDANGGSISRLDANGVISTFRRSTLSVRAMTQGPGNSIWFINNVSGKEIGRISATGTMTFFAAPREMSSLRSISQTPDGALWMTSRGAIARVTYTDNSGMLFDIFPDVFPWGHSDISVSREHYLWFSNANFFTLSQITM